MRTAAVLPVKSFVRAKQRLGESVADRLRLELASAMVSDVLEALAQTAAIEHTIVVTREPTVADLLAQFASGASIVADEAESGQSAAAGLGIQHAIQQGFQRVLCVPGDCPALDPAELQALLEGDSGPEPRVTIVPDRHGAGTNGLLLAPPLAIAPGFGPDSCERHRLLALDAHIAARIQPLSSLVLDIDTGADLQALRDRLQGHRERAARTRAVLDAHGRREIIETTTRA